MDCITKRIAVLARAYRDGRLHVDEAVAWGVEADFTNDDCVALMERCADSEIGGTRDERIANLLVNAYKQNRLHIDEVLVWADELNVLDPVALLDLCGEVDLALAAA